MTYIKGQMDKGDLAEKFVALVVFDDKNQAMSFLRHAEVPWAKQATVHEIVASQYDIDYNIHKLLIYPAEPVTDA